MAWNFTFFFHSALLVRRQNTRTATEAKSLERWPVVKFHVVRVLVELVCAIVHSRRSHTISTSCGVLRLFVKVMCKKHRIKYCVRMSTVIAPFVVAFFFKFKDETKKHISKLK